MLGCAVLTPSPLATPSPFVVVDFFLGRFFGLGLVGRVRASVPTFWWYSPSLVLGFAWRLWPFGGPGTCYFLGSYLGFFRLSSSVGCCLRWLRFILGCPPSVASLWRFLPGLFVWSLLACPRSTAVSGPVCVLPQSTIVTLLSLLWLGLLFVFVQFHCLRLTLWASACVG